MQLEAQQARRRKAGRDLHSVPGKDAKEEAQNTALTKTLATIFGNAGSAAGERRGCIARF
jgi:hypothetical protein